MKHILCGLAAGTCVIGLSMAAPAMALTKQKVTVVGIPDDAERIEGTRCVMPNVCANKEGIFKYDPGVWGVPKLRTGDVVLRDGTKIAGRVAMINYTSDWGFVKRAIVMVPEGEADAIFINSTDAVLITQQKKDETLVYDAYDGYYLERLVSGPMRLSFNPAAGTNGTVKKFIPPAIINNASGAVGREAVIAALRDGKTVDESLSDGQSVGTALGQALSSIEITEKEYLLYDEAQDQLRAITKENYPATMQSLFSGCVAADAKQVKSFAKKYKKIQDAIVYFNANCA